MKKQNMPKNLNLVIKLQITVKNHQTVQYKEMGILQRRRCQTQNLQNLLNQIHPQNQENSHHPSHLPVNPQ